MQEDDDLKSLSDADKALYADAVTQLVGTLVHNDARVRRACLRSLRALDPSQDQLMPVVDTVLRHRIAVILPVLQVLLIWVQGCILIERLKLPQGQFWASVALTEVVQELLVRHKHLLKLCRRVRTDEQLHGFCLGRGGEGAQSAGEALVKLYSDGDSLHG